MEKVLRAVPLKNYVEVAGRCGLDGVEMLRRHELAPGMIADPEALIPYSNVLRLLEDSAKQSGREDFGLLMAESRKLADLGDVSLVICHQRTLRDALNTAIEYGNLINPYFAMRLENIGKQVFIHEETLADTDLPKRQAVELSVALIVQTCRSLMGAQWTPRRVCFAHPRPTALQMHERVFGCKVEFNAQRNGLLCNAADLDAPNPKADPEMAVIARRFMTSATKDKDDGFLFDLRKTIYLLMPLGKAKIQRVAQALGISVRTLQRKLGNEEKEFSEVLNDVRRELVFHHLENTHYTVQRVSMMLGYTVPTSFTRWFLAEFGITPQGWRHRCGREAETSAAQMSCPQAALGPQARACQGDPACHSANSAAGMGMLMK
jgi:AraC-like DNA-binding protein